MYNPLRHCVTADQLPKDRTIADMPTAGMWAFIWFFVRQVKWPLLLIVVLHLLSSLIFASGPYFIKELVDGFEQTDHPSDIWDAFGWSLPAFIGLYLVLQPILSRIRTVGIAEVRMPWMSMIRRQISLYMYHHRYQYFQKGLTPDLR